MLKWILLIYASTHQFAVQGYETEGRCIVAKEIVERELALPPHHAACFPGNDAIPGSQETPHEHSHP